MRLMEIPDPAGAKHPHSAKLIQVKGEQLIQPTLQVLAPSHSGLFDNNCGELTQNKDINTAANTPKDKTTTGH